MQDSTADQPLLLGTVGWERGDWLRDYYPSDLPPEWRLAYFANDCDCVLLPAHQWYGVDREELEESLDEAGDRPLFFLERPPRVSPQVRANLALFAPWRAVVLVEQPDPAYARFSQWVLEEAGCWVDTESDRSLVRWSLDAVDLRDWRARADGLPGSLSALVLDGPGANPGRIRELRTLLELLGRA